MNTPWSKEGEAIMNRIAIIPARSGSKGLKDKNIINLCGKPLIAYSIEAATKSGLFSRVIVSTDSERYGEIAQVYGQLQTAIAGAERVFIVLDEADEPMDGNAINAGILMDTA